MADTLRLTVVSQEQELLSTEVDSVTAPAIEGEVTILPGHLPLFTQLDTGLLLYRRGKEEDSIVISKGFLDVGPDNTITVMVDTAVYARDISLEKAQAAIAAAKEVMASTQDRRELIMAEASLRRALLEIKIAEATKKRGL